MKNLLTIFILVSGITLSSCNLPSSKSASSSQLLASSLSKKNASSSSAKSLSRISSYGDTVSTNIAIQASIESSPTGFEKYVYTFELPVSQANWVAFSGNASITNKSSVFTEMLISYFYYNGPCPASGQHFDTYEELGAADPGIVIIAHYIVKNPGLGTSEVPIHFALPTGVPITGCVGAILDGGGISGKPAPITMASNVVMTYTTAPEPYPPALAGMGGEYCFGQNWGCQAAVKIAGNFNGTQNFASAGTIGAGTLVAIFGDVADSSFDGIDQTNSPLPSESWGATNDFYLLPGGCGPFVVNGTTGAGTTNLYNLIPSNAVHILSLPLSGNGKESLQQSIYQPLNVPVNSGDCLVTIFGRQGNGASDDETQMMVLINPPGMSTTPVAVVPQVILNHTVVGIFDGINPNADGSYSVAGWACVQGSTQSIHTAVYVGGPEGSGTFVGNFAANESSEPAVAAACQSSGSAYRFASTIPAAFAQKYNGQSVYVYGVSPGSADAVLNNSGNFKLPKLVPVYREYNPSTGWHMMSLSGTENTPLYHLEGTSFHLYSYPVGTNTTVLYRCSYAGGYFVSRDSNCEGQTFNSVLGWAHSSAVGAEVPIYRFYSPWNGDHLITVNPSEGYSNGYNVEEIMGYGLP